MSSSVKQSCENDRLLFTNTILAEVKKRPLIWKKKHPAYNSRQALLDAWADIGKSVGVTYDVARARWRCLRDLFQKEMRRIQIVQQDGGDIKNLRLWLHFRSMLFLKEEYPDIDVSALEPEELAEITDAQDSFVKVKIENFEHYDESSRDDIQGTEYIQAAPELDGDIDPISRSGTLNNDSESSKGHTTETNASSVKKRKTNDGRQEDSCDEDMLFVKSLVPYFKGMDPVRKLRLKSKIQNLIADELMKD